MIISSIIKIKIRLSFSKLRSENATIVHKLDKIWD